MYCKAKLIHHVIGEEHPQSSCLRLVQQELLSSCVRQCRRGFWLTCYPDEILGGSGIQIALRCMTISQLYGSQHHVNVFFCLRMNECSLHRGVLHAAGFCLLSLYSCPSGNGFRSFFWKLYVYPKNIYNRHIGRQPVESNYFYIYVEFFTGDNNIGEDFRLALPVVDRSTRPSSLTFHLGLLRRLFRSFRLQYPFVSEAIHSLKYRKSNQPVQGSVEDSELMVRSRMNEEYLRLPTCCRNSTFRSERVACSESTKLKPSTVELNSRLLSVRLEHRVLDVSQVLSNLALFNGLAESTMSLLRTEGKETTGEILC
ncbi:hypothetical protein OUZ56_003333 [Daphnia magna]|uniref:Uncharacterized protein n=1 Tax=Daphnia magna TaxID=35525 RepID=A0ABR0A8F9_9CRUS|nr:hypothetical protein OUZ56_003333 [Daphnia magna]